jgi:hypothetical protein
VACFAVASGKQIYHHGRMRLLSRSQYSGWLVGFSLIFGFSLISLKAWSYPSFIGYGYTSCMTCHYNPLGNGQLSDYGRGLFATEIAAKPFWNKHIKDDDLTKTASFTLQEPTPRFLHPSFKYRELYLSPSLGGNNTYKRYVMQADAGVALHFDEADKYIFVGSVGYTRLPLNADIKEGAWNYNLLTHEHYLRTQLTDTQYLTVGLIDIAYGIRIADHTAVNRAGIGLDQNSQVHGILYNYFPEKWSIAVHGFVGNQLRDEISRITGASTMVEYEVKEKMTVGFSALAGSTQLQKQTLTGIHSRIGVGQGSSIMTEVGLNRLEPKVGDSTTGGYGIVIGTMRIIRGLDFESQLEMLKSSLSEASQENYRYSVGFIYFPFQRVELRLQATDGRSLSPTQVEGDAWSLQSQLHLSL